MGSDGEGGDLLCRPSGGSRNPPTAEHLREGKQYMFMDGRAVFRWAVDILCDTIQDVLADQRLTPADVDLYVPHQANIRIINAAIDALHIPRKVYNNLDRYGNTSAGSIPLAAGRGGRRRQVEGRPSGVAVRASGPAWRGARPSCAGERICDRGNGRKEPRLNSFHTREAR